MSELSAEERERIAREQAGLANEGEGKSEPEAERHPAGDQSPVATDRMKAIQGDPGFGEQNPQAIAPDVDRPVGTSPPPPSAQSGVPLQEDRERGVVAGDVPPLKGPDGSTPVPAPPSSGQTAEPDPEPAAE